MVGALARDHAHALAFAAGTVIGEAHLDGRVHGLRAGVGEKYLVDAFRGERRNTPGKLELRRVPALERRTVIELHQLFGDRVGDLAPAVTGGAAEQSR